MLHDIHHVKRLVGAVSLIGLLLAGGPANAEDSKVNMRLSHNLPTNNALHYGVIQPWVESIEQASGGSIDIDIYPAQQLGGAKDHYNMARDGIVDIAFYLVGIEPGRFPIITAAEIPFLVSDNSRGSRALFEWYQPYAKDEMSDVKVCVLFYDGGGTIHSRKQVKVPSDLDGLKIRSPNKMAAELYRLAGASPLQMSANDAAEAVERGVVDAISFPWKLTIALGADRALKYHLDTTLYSLATGLFMNKSSYDRLSEAQKKVMDEHCNADWSEELPKAWTAFENEGREIMVNSSDHNLHTLTPEELGEWQTVASGVRELWEADLKTNGLDGKKIFDELEEALRTYNARY